MTKEKLPNIGGILLIVFEVSLITFVSYAVEHYLPLEIGRYISLDVLYCLPIIQTARLAAIHAMRRTDTQTSTFVGIALAFVWSSTETALFWPFPINAFVLNVFTRSVVFTVLGRVMVRLWRERELARKDTLTGLSNRMELVESLKTEQNRSERTGRPYSLLFIDIDRFKVLNDIHGHRIGDEALRMLAEILKNKTRKEDIVSRLGGDEFVLLLPDTDERSCDILVRRIQESADRIFQEQLWPISLSIGRVTGTGLTHEADWVIHMADEDMYEVKRTKREAIYPADKLEAS
jgi:diguanylate cyclase (GGDEF)-like protein